MKTWPQRPSVQIVEKEPQLPKTEPNFLSLQCLYGSHKAEVMHRGTVYCRACYDARNVQGKLIDQ